MITADIALQWAENMSPEEDTYSIVSALSDEVIRLRATSLADSLERSVELCRVAREKERAAVVRWLRTNKYYADHSLEFADDIEAGDHVRNELGGRDEHGVK